MQAVLGLFRLAASACGTRTGLLPSLYDNVPCTDGNIDINSVSDVLIIVGNVSRILIALAGGIAVIVVIVAAIFYITSTGDPGRIKRAKDIIVNTAIGLIIILVAYAVVTYIATGF
jgi:Type IV secretion system pilin